MSDALWFRPLVWMDYRLALLFIVFIPLILLIWAFIYKAESIQRLLIIYWRVASLLGISVYLMIASLPIGFIAGAIARILIPISLWFWVDLNEEIDDQPNSGFKLSFTSWRWAMTIYGILSACGQIPFWQCGLLSSPQMVESPSCQVWLEPTWLYKQIFHYNSSVKFLGFLAIVALLIYVIYLSYFVLIKLGKQGRSATGH